jgi:molybdopterin/thiamine biosynthesis adenylyltransferase
LVSGSAIRLDGQIAVYDTQQDHAPCYACIFPPNQHVEETRCATMGVLAPWVGVIGSLQASEALKILSGMGSALVGKLMMLDARFVEWQTIQTQRNPQCPVCSPFRG